MADVAVAAEGAVEAEAEVEAEEVDVGGGERSLTACPD